MRVYGYSHSMRLFELANLLDLVHEVSSINILHDKIQPVLKAVIERQDRKIGGLKINFFKL